MTAPVLALSLLAAATWFAYFAAIRPADLLVVSLALSIAAQTEPGLDFGLLPRVVLALAVGTAILVSRPGLHQPDHRLGRSAWAPAQFSALVVLFAATLPSTSSLLVTGSAVAGAAAVFAVGIVLGRALGISAILDKLFVASAGFLFASILVSPASWASESDRLRGVLENANMLGAVAALAAATCPATWRKWLWPIAAGTIWFTGSRASAIAFVIIVLFRIEWRSSARLAALVTVPVIAALGGLAFVALDAPIDETESVAIVEEELGQSSSEEGNTAALLRTRDNRTAQWQQGVDDARAALPLGTGFGTAAFEYSNSPLFLAVETGLLAIPIVALVAFILWTASRGTDRRAAALFAGFGAHAMFEGWMFAFGSALAVTFWLVAAAGAASRTTGPGEPGLKTPAELREPNQNRRQPLQASRSTRSSLGGTRDPGARHGH